MAVLLGNGDGTFRPRTEYATGVYPLHVAVGDLDANGCPDLVLPAHTDDQVTVLLGDGTGAFPARSPFAVLAPTVVAIADLDANGTLDLAASSDSSSVSVLLGNGDGTFQPKLDFATPGFSYCVATGDLNRDGAPDLAVANRFANSVSVFLNRSRVPSLFGRRMDVEAGEIPTDIAVGDLDRDGRLDLVATNPGWTGQAPCQGDSATKVSVLLGRGDGTFGARTPFEVGSAPWSIALGDMDRDGKLDVATGNYFSPTISILLGNGDGSLREATDFGLIFGANHIALGDLDRDGCPDLVATGVDSNRAGRAEVLLGDGNGSFASAAAEMVGVDPHGVELGDLNRDGCLDIVVANLWSHDVSVLLGHGDGTTFDDMPRLATGEYPAHIAIGDANRDGRLDVAVADTHVSLFLGRGDGTFEPRRVVDTGGGQSSVVILTDLNVDGRQDLAIGCDSEVRVMMGRGDGTFQPAVPYAALNQPMALVAADLNRDAAPDLLLNQVCTDKVGVFVNLSLTIPVAVEDLEVTEHEGLVRLTWRLAREAQDDLLGVRVERAGAADGPYAACAASLLVPEESMAFADPDVENGREYWYRIVLVFGGGAEQAAGQVRVRTGSGKALLTTLHQPREQPGGGTVEIRYSLARTHVPVRLAIYDVRGREVWMAVPHAAEPGEHRLVWDERDAAGAPVVRGVYFLRLEAGGVTAARKLVLVHH